METKSTNNYILGGSFSLKIRGLLHRKTKDIDISLNKHVRKLQKFLKNCFKVDIAGVNKWPNEYDVLSHKGYWVKCTKVWVVLFWKLYYVKKSKDPLKSKHRFDIINVFHNLGRDESLKQVEKIKEVLKDEKDIKLLYELMEIGLSNKEEIY